MKVIAFNGSPRPNGNTANSIKIVLGELAKAGIATELVQLGGLPVFGCLACDQCGVIKDRRCVRSDDAMNELIAKLLEADGIIIGSPTYFGNVTTEVKAFIDRGGRVARSNGNLLKGKVGAPVVVMRRAGGNFVYAAINYFFGINEMIIPSSSYWNLVVARNLGEWENDREGIGTMETLGRNMAALMHSTFRV